MQGIHIFPIFPESQVVVAIPGGTMIGPVIEGIVKILEEYGLYIFRCDIQRNRAFCVWNSRIQ